MKYKITIITFGIRTFSSPESNVRSVLMEFSSCASVILNYRYLYQFHSTYQIITSFLNEFTKIYRIFHFLEHHNTNDAKHKQCVVLFSATGTTNNMLCQFDSYYSAFDYSVKLAVSAFSSAKIASA